MTSKTDKKRRKQLLLQQKFPNDCFCDIDHSFSDEEFIEERSWYNEFPVLVPPRWETNKYYRCPICGKEYADYVLIA
ncbi:MAG TPA: hypothetical protein DC057_02415 [Spirochaetia bacterium]|nr:hypothetical protein [Spirochaetia bacterium]